MARLAFFICSDRAFGAKTINSRTGARTQFIPELNQQAYRCKGPAEFEELNRTKVREGRMWSAILADDNGVLRPLTDADEIGAPAPLSSIRETPDGEEYEVGAPEPSGIDPASLVKNERGLTPAEVLADEVAFDDSMAKETATLNKLFGPDPAAETFPVEQNPIPDAPAFFRGEADAPLAKEVTAESRATELTDAPPETPPPAMSNLKRIVAALRDGPKRLGDLAGQISMEREAIQSLAAESDSPFTIGGKALWCKLA